MQLMGRKRCNSWGGRDATHGEEEMQLMGRKRCNSWGGRDATHGEEILSVQNTYIVLIVFKSEKIVRMKGRLRMEEEVL